MNIKFAAKATQNFIDANLCLIGREWPEVIDEKLSYTHTSFLLESIKLGKVSDEKAHRWLGWAQCACVSAGMASLEDMKRINHES